MHILSVDQRKHRKKRTRSEKVFQRLNTLVLACQLATLLVTIGLLVSAAEKSMSNAFFSESNLNLDTIYNYKNCTATFVTSNGLFNDYPISISRFNIQFIVARSVYNIRICIAMFATFIGIGAVNKLLFDMNIHYLTVGHIHLRKDVVTTAELCFMVMAFITTKHIERENAWIDDYVTSCSRSFVTRGSDVSSLYQTLVPFVAFYVGLGISAVVHFLSMAVGFLQMWVEHPRDLPGFGMAIPDGHEEDVVRRSSVYGGNFDDEDPLEQTENPMFEASGGYQFSEDPGDDVEEVVGRGHRGAPEEPPELGRDGRGGSSHRRHQHGVDRRW